MVATESPEIVLQALRTRRSVPRVKPERPPRELVERILEAGSLGPNHYRTEPWRFIVLTGSARAELGDVMAEALQAKLADPDGSDAAAVIERERRKPLRAPVVIAVGVEVSDQPKVVEIEEIAAVAAGVENMLLAAHALGLGAMWRTGAPARDPLVKRFLGLSERGHLLAFVYLGYPDAPDVPERERTAERHTRWLGWD